MNRAATSSSSTCGRRYRSRVGVLGGNSISVQPIESDNPSLARLLPILEQPLVLITASSTSSNELSVLRTNPARRTRVFRQQGGRLEVSANWGHLIRSQLP